MQASTQPQAPPEPIAPAVSQTQLPAPIAITTLGADGKAQTLAIPKTEGEIRELRAHRDELSSQLTSVASRRNSLSEQIRSAPEGASRIGLESRIRLLDQRILQLETDIAATGRQISAAPADLLQSTQQSPSGGDDWAEGMAAGTFSTLFVVGIVVVYRRFRRRRRGAAPPPANLLSESAQRLERVEHAVEAIALEVERVGEGQRFVTKLLSESPERQPVDRPTV